MNAYTFPTELAASQALALAEAEMRAIAAERGFTVRPDGAVLGKNAATGQDDPNTLTLRWAEVQSFADGTWGFPSVRPVFSTMFPRVESAASLPSPREVEPAA